MSANIGRPRAPCPRLYPYMGETEARQTSVSAGDDLFRGAFHVPPKGPPTIGMPKAMLRKQRAEVLTTSFSFSEAAHDEFLLRS